MYRAGRLRRVFRARGKLVGTSDFVVTKGYVQIRVVGFPWETASLEAVVRRQDGALLLRRERAEARLWVYRRRHRLLAWDFSSVAADGARRRGVPVSNGAPPLLGGPWASKLRPPSENSVPRRRLAPRFAG